jgi:hypothetical protein
MMIAEYVSLAKDLVTLLAILIGSATAVFVYFQLAPVLQLRIVPTWADERKEFLILRFEIENRSRVRIFAPKGRIQVLKHDIQPGASMSHWIPFREDAVKPDERPREWREPVEIFKSTLDIYPGETISFERIYDCPEDTVVVHAGLQVELELSRWGRWVTRKAEPWRQTTTRFVAKHIEKA